MVAVVTVACGSSKKTAPETDNKDGVYNQWATDLSQSNNAFDQQTLNWYKNNTASVFVASNGSNTGSQGTIWNYPNPSNDAFGHHFATNIHVVADALIPAVGNTYALNSDYNFYTSRNTQMNEQLCEVSLYYIATQARPTGLTGGQWNGDWYNDFIILRTTTPIFPYPNTTNFMDSVEEYNWLMNNVSSASFYSCGFPALNDAGWPNSSKWVNVKYTWDASKAQSSFTPTIGTAATYSSGYLNLSNPDGLKIGSETKRLAKGYARQIMLPELNTQGGSSGSLVSVQYNGSLMLVGIYWGGYEFDNNEFLGGVALLYTGNSYSYGSYGTAPAYSNLK